jgi:calcineurin-like phosphoesterase family protein
VTVWFISDTHFGHANILRYCKRPFGSIEEMNEAFVKNWNDRVSNGDLVYHLGDFAFFKTKEEVDSVAKRLKGQKHLVRGNHDRNHTQKCGFFADVKDYKEIEVQGQKIVLMHYAMKVWNRSHHGSWQLHGHSHGTLPRDLKSKQLDMGVDCWNYVPVSFEEVSKEMEKHTFVPVDRHGQED